MLSSLSLPGMTVLQNHLLDFAFAQVFNSSQKYSY